MSFHIVQPDLVTDVRADPGAADDLVRQLVATAGGLGEALAVLAGDGPLIAGDWGGPHRLAFDADREQVLAVGHALADALFAAAGHVASVLAEAEGEQRLRERLRAEVGSDGPRSGGPR
jgi:hypothetical protein